MGLGVPVFEVVDLGDELVDFAVLGLHLALQFGVALLQFDVLLGLGLAHHAALLAQPLDLAAQHDDLEGELVGEGFLLLELLLVALQPPLVPLDVCGQPHDVVLRGEVRTCCSWREISISPFLLSSGSSLEYWLRSSSY